MLLRWLIGAYKNTTVFNDCLKVKTTFFAVGIFLVLISVVKIANKLESDVKAILNTNSTLLQVSCCWGNVYEI